MSTYILRISLHSTSTTRRGKYVREWIPFFDEYTSSSHEPQQGIFNRLYSLFRKREQTRPYSLSLSLSVSLPLTIARLYPSSFARTQSVMRNDFSIFLATSRKKQCRNACAAGTTYADCSRASTTRRRTRQSRSHGTRYPIEVTLVIWRVLSMSPASHTRSGNPTSRSPIYARQTSKTMSIFSVTTARIARRRLTPVSN